METTASQTASGKTYKILVVEDEKPLSKALYLKLTHSGFDVTCVFDGEEAIEVLKKDKFDLLTLDLILPKVDGFKVLEEMAANNISVKTLIATNLSQEEDFERAKKFGVSDFFVKSNTPISEVVAQIKRLLGISA